MADPSPSLASYARHAEWRMRHRSSADNVDVSVITVTLNAVSTIARTIESVQAQTCAAIEQIFVDGGSTDGTADIIGALLRPQDCWLMEPDRGISDAFNKGIALSRGRFIQILNGDDWLSHDQLAVAIKTLESTHADFVFGDVIFHDRDGRPIFTYRGDPNYAQVIHRRMPPIGHPSVLVRRGCFERIGLFNPAYRCAMDYDWLLRLHRTGGHGVYCEGMTAHMNHGGVSNRQFHRTIEEVRHIAVAHGRNPLVAALEAGFRHLKTAVAQPMRRHFRPLYEVIRRSINRAYRPNTVSQ